MTKPRNVILISTDQHRGDCLGVESRSVETPHLDRLCREGTHFSTCITPHPMCQPARASILTGKLPYSHGVRDNGRNLDKAFAKDGLGGMFSDAGFKTTFIGKAHFGSNETFHATGYPECYFSTADYPADWNGPYFGFETVELMLRPHHHCTWKDRPYTLHYENFLDANGGGSARWAKAKDHVPPETSHMQVWRSALEAEWHSSSWIGDRAVEMIEGSGDTPFFAWASFPDPHPPFLVAKPWSDMYPPDAVDLPEHRELDLDNRPWWHRAFVDSPARKKISRPHAEGGIFWGDTSGIGDRELRDITAIYYAMISAVDHQVGRIIKALESADKLGDTLIVFISDHGEWLGDHGLLLKGPMLYDGLLRVPCIFRGPSVPKGVVIDAPVSTLDLHATFAEICGLRARETDGTSLVPVMRGQGTREFALNEWEVDAERSGIDLDLRTLRTRRHRMSVDLITKAGELYDLQEDPHETVNLFDDPGHTGLRDEMQGMLASRPDTIIPAAPRVGWH